MRRLQLLVVLSLFLPVTVLSGCSGDSLGSSLGSLELELCDRGDACGCGTVEPRGTTIDFGSPDPGDQTRRILTLRNDNPGNILEVRSVVLEGATNVFGLIGVQLVEGDSTSSHDFANGPMTLTGDAYAEVILGFKPTAAGRFDGTVRVLSNSDVQADWIAELRGGAGGAQVCVPNGNCGDGSVVDFGQFPDSVVEAFTQEERIITVENTGESAAFVSVELLDDGIPEIRPNEQPGEIGVFALGEVPCAVVEPGETVNIPVLYRPFVAGEHRGEVRIGGIGDAVTVELLGRVVGPRICFRTEDD
ncbi:MAG: hypothetical protein AAF658_05250, partial [Myxococcota bacterium]